METAIESVNTYYEAFGRKDWKKVRAVLAEDFTFKGPLMSFNSAEAFIEAVGNLPFEATVEGSRFIAEGNRVAHAFLWKMTAPAKVDIPMCEVFELLGAKIRSAELFYDARLFPTGNVQS